MLGGAGGLSPPPVVETIARETEALGFAMASEARVGALLRVLAAAKPGGRFLELGTGTGLATAWLLAGMDTGSRLVTVEVDPACAAVARRHLGHDDRLEIRVENAASFLEDKAQAPFDLIFADSLPGKYEGLDRALELLAPGGIYVVDDMLPQASWPAEHGPRVDALLGELGQRRGFVRVELNWTSGVVIVVRRIEARAP